MGRYNHKIKKKVMLTIYLSVAFGVAMGYLFGGRGYKDDVRILENFGQKDVQVVTYGFSLELATIVSLVCIVLGIAGVLVVKKLKERDFL